MRYLLDANAVIATLNDPHSKVARRLRRERPGEVVISAIVAHELYYGAFKSRRIAANLDAVDSLLFATIEFDKEDSRQAGEVRAYLAGRGTPIGPLDVLIAGQCIARDLILVTWNTGEFMRIPTLQVENWEQ
jgi:tRNA(fMet)-specific endonuclease VapC